MSELKRAIESLATQQRQKTGAMESVLGKVTAVQTGENTCTVEALDNEADVYYGVRLQADLVSTNCWRLIPKIGSIVIVGLIGKNDHYLAMTSEIDKVSLRTDTEDMKELLADLLTAIKVLTVPTSVGPSGVPINIADFTAIETRLNDFFE